MNLFRLLPAVDELQKDEQFSHIQKKYEMSEKSLTPLLAEAIQSLREEILKGEITEADAVNDGLKERIFSYLKEKIKGELDLNLLPVINATGVVLHTNLGRARLSEAALKQINDVARGYSTLEYNIEKGTRGSRHDLVEDYLCDLTGAEAAMVVNNNASAVYITLRALAKDKEVIVSRGELIEIGGSFRVSEIMAESGAQLVEVGTSNKTHLKDYQGAITEETSMLMKVHKSNFDLVGFSAEIDTGELLDLAKKHDLPIYEDLGSGTLYDFKEDRIGKEPTVKEKLEAGIDLISFSGDKLLGGPQAGIIVGKKEYIDALKSHQLARVLRVDKFTLAGLEATLQAYVKGMEREEIPTVRDIRLPAEKVRRRAEVFKQEVTSKTGNYSLEIEQDVSKVGGGTMPTVDLATYVVKVKHRTYSSGKLAEKLRELRFPIIVRMKDEQVLVDFRTIDENEIQGVIEGFLAVDKGEEK